jgi:hypothetical protein
MWLNQAPRTQLAHHLLKGPFLTGWMRKPCRLFNLRLIGNPPKKQVKILSKVVHVKVLRTPDPVFNDETLRVISSSPAWTPAMQSGIKVKQMFVKPVDFNLNDPTP